MVLAVLGLMVGCAGTSTQRVAYNTTAAIGQAADDASKAFVDIEVNKAMQALGPGATQSSVSAWVHARPEWTTFNSLRDKFNTAYTSWCFANAALAAGTNASAALADPQFRIDAVNAAAALTGFIVQFVPTVQTVQPVVK